jgi:hypothetical protein
MIVGIFKHFIVYFLWLLGYGRTTENSFPSTGICLFDGFRVWNFSKKNTLKADVLTRMKKKRRLATVSSVSASTSNIDPDR